jgi:phosphatidylinositol phospholipase C, delta
MNIIIIDSYLGSSISESKFDKLIEDDPFGLIKLTNKSLIKVYPAAHRQFSSNYNPVPYWNHGTQIVSLNFQTEDLAMSLNEALFQDNGSCGYILKPLFLRMPNLLFNPNNPNEMPNKKIFEIRIISAQNLPRTDKENLIKDISDPFVKINIYGVPSDCNEERTKIIDNNGFNPMWNEHFKFRINCPELAFVRFTVYDYDTATRNDFIGEYSIRFENIRPGYRHIKLKNKEHKGTLFVGITIKPLTS